jgi:DNA-binding transcriptional LysR family regulator
MTGAAGALGIARSGVSAHLKQLEGDLGVRLLDRTTRTMQVTSVGEQVYERATQMVRAGQAALDAVDAHRGAVRGTLRVVIPDDLGIDVLLPVVVGLRTAQPDLRIEIVAGDHPVDLIRDGVDVAVRVGVPADSGMTLHRLAQLEEIFVASPVFASWHGLEDASALALAPRVDHPAVDPLQSFAVDAEGNTLRLALGEPVVRVASSDLVRRFVIEGVGWASLPELFVRRDLAAKKLKRVAAPWFRRKVEIYALTPSRVVSPAVQVFLDAVRAELA